MASPNEPNAHAYPQKCRPNSTVSRSRAPVTSRKEFHVRLTGRNCLKNGLHSCKCSGKKSRCHDEKDKLYDSPDQPDLSLPFFHAFSAFPNASTTALMIPVELKVAPDTVSTSVLCAEIIELITPSPCERYAASSPGALVTCISVISSPESVT